MSNRYIKTSSRVMSRAKLAPARHVYCCTQESYQLQLARGKKSNRRKSPLVDSPREARHRSLPRKQLRLSNRRLLVRRHAIQPEPFLRCEGARKSGFATEAAHKFSRYCKYRATLPLYRHFQQQRPLPPPTRALSTRTRTRANWFGCGVNH
jgi:hypothetical protein